MRREIATPADTVSQWRKGEGITNIARLHMSLLAHRYKVLMRAYFTEAITLSQCGDLQFKGNIWIQGRKF